MLARTLWWDSEPEKFSVDCPFFFFFCLSVFANSVFSPSHIGPVAHLCTSCQPFLLSVSDFPKGSLWRFFQWKGDKHEVYSCFFCFFADKFVEPEISVPLINVLRWKIAWRVRSRRCFRFEADEPPKVSWARLMIEKWIQKKNSVFCFCWLFPPSSQPWQRSPTSSCLALNKCCLVSKCSYA